MGYPFEHWIGVDFDGTLVEYHEWLGLDKFGSPIFPMIYRVRAWLAQGKAVRIVTARVASVQDPDNLERAYEAIRQWCIKYLGQAIPIQAEKDPGMTELWDDSAIHVEHNTGVAGSGILFVGGPHRPIKPDEAFCEVSEAMQAILSLRFSLIILAPEARCLQSEILQAVREGKLNRMMFYFQPMPGADQYDFEDRMIFYDTIQKFWNERTAAYLKEVQS